MNYTQRTKLVDRVCGAALMALLVEIFYGLVDASYTTFYLNINTVTNVVHIIGGVLLAVALLMLIFAYRKENDSLALYGTELLIFSITAGILPATYTEFAMPFNKLNAVFPLLFGVYYIGKVLYIFSKRNLSNAIMFGIVETIYIAMYVYDLLNINMIMFYIGSAITIAAFIGSIIKKSKYIFVHALELMIFSFAFLLFNSSTVVVFFGILTAIYYAFKSFFVLTPKVKKNKKGNKNKVKK